MGPRTWKETQCRTRHLGHTRDWICVTADHTEREGVGKTNTLTLLSSPTHPVSCWGSALTTGQTQQKGQGGEPAGKLSTGHLPGVERREEIGGWTRRNRETQSGMGYHRATDTGKLCNHTGIRRKNTILSIFHIKFGRSIFKIISSVNVDLTEQAYLLQLIRVKMFIVSGRQFGISSKEW